VKAAYLTGHGGNEVVAVGERPRPARRAGEVLVRLHAATVNRVDLYMRDSGAGITHELPMIMGLDGAGVVEEIDADERTLSVGQRVVLHPGTACGRCEFCLRGDDTLCTSMRLLGEHRDGTFAELISLPARNVFPMPEHLSFGEAAALGVNHITAWSMLHGKAHVKPWETVLVFGVGGGVSLAALQLAKLSGARVLVTSRDPAKLERARALCADAAIDGRGDIVKQVMAATGGRGVDVVIENVGAAVWSAALKSLVRGGRLVTCGATTGDQPPADIRRIFIRQLQILGSTMGSFSEFTDLLSLVQRSGLKPVIDSEVALGDVHGALDRLDSGAQFGKIVVNLGVKP
jgi:NADPH:quinone reductase-like Zn-dependent oxidoreductase